MGCSEALARIFVFVTNFCFVLVGLLLLVIGIIFKVGISKVTQGIPGDYHAVEQIPVVSIVVGVIIFFIAFLGCCGTLKSSVCMLTSYGSIVFIIFLIQMGLGIFALVTIKDTGDFRAKLDKTVEELFDKYSDKNKTLSFNEEVNAIQEALKCCGTTGIEYWVKKGIKVPKSCPLAPTTPGCQQALYDLVLDSVKLIGTVALGVSVVEVAGAILALCLSNCIRGRQGQRPYY